jgi:hypothetical protein
MLGAPQEALHWQFWQDWSSGQQMGGWLSSSWRHSWVTLQQLPSGKTVASFGQHTRSLELEPGMGFGVRGQHMFCFCADDGLMTRAQVPLQQNKGDDCARAFNFMHMLACRKQATGAAATTAAA